MAASSLVSYERARAESLGFTARGGLMERAERMLALGASLLFSAVMVPILWVMLALTLFTAGHRFVMVWRQASAARPPKPKPTLAGVAGRWRGWTPGVSFGPAARGQERPRWGTGADRGPRPDAARRRPPPQPAVDPPRRPAGPADRPSAHGRRSVGGRSRGLAPPGPQPAVAEPAPTRVAGAGCGPYYVFRAASAVANALPERMAVPLARRLASAAVPFVGNRRDGRPATSGGPPSAPLDQRRSTGPVRGAFASYGRYWMESLRLPSMDPDRIAAGSRSRGWATSRRPGPRARGRSSPSPTWADGRWAGPGSCARASR